MIEKTGIMNEFDVFLFVPFDNMNLNYYRNLGISVIDDYSFSQIECDTKLNSIKYYKNYLSSIKKLSKANLIFDVVHISYASMEKILSIPYLRKISKKIVVTFWGSDLFRVGTGTLKFYKRYLNKVDEISLSTNDMFSKFHKIYGEKYNSKLRRVRFGVDGFSFINVISSSDKSKSLFNLPFDKKIVTIGYNGNSSQQHLKVLDVISRMPDDLQKNMFILIPATYGLNTEYKHKLIEALDGLSCKYRLFEDYMDDETLGHLRKATDCFIHAQLTDALSASVQEYLYAQKLVFNPSWIIYEDFDELGIYYKKYKSFDDLIHLLSDYIIRGVSQETEQRLQNNSKLLKRISDWNVVAVNWKELYLKP